MGLRLQRAKYTARLYAPNSAHCATVTQLHQYTGCYLQCTLARLDTYCAAVYVTGDWVNLACPA